MFRVTAVSEDVPGSSPAAVVRDGQKMVLVLSAGLLAPEVVQYLDVLLRIALSPILAAAPGLGYGVG